MSVLMSLFLWGLAVGLIIAGVLVSTPWKFTVRWRSAPQFEIAVHAQPFGGIVPGFELTAPQNGTSKAKTVKSVSRFDVRGKPQKMAHMLRLFVDLVTGIIHRTDIEHVKAEVEFGGGDPAETGQIYGLLTPLIFAIHIGDKMHLVARPNFDERCLHGAADICIRIVPIIVAIPFIHFAWRLYGLER